MELISKIVSILTKVILIDYDTDSDQYIFVLFFAADIAPITLHFIQTFRIIKCVGNV